MSSLNVFPNYRKLQNVLTAMLTGATFLTAAAAMDAGRVHAEDLVVKYDQSQLLRLPRRVSEIIIGNPTIADVTVQSGTLLVITGKTFGITNLIVLDAERKVILDQRVVVSRDGTKVVNLTRGSARQSYNCTPECNPSLVIGDDKAFFGNVAKAGQEKLRFASGAADSSGSSGAQ